MKMKEGEGYTAVTEVPDVPVEKKRPAPTFKAPSEPEAPAAKDNVLKLVPNAPAKTEDETEKTAEPVAEVKERLRDLGLLEESMDAVKDAKGRTIDASFFERQLGRKPEVAAKIIEELKILGVISSDEPYKVDSEKLENELAKLTLAKAPKADEVASEVSHLPSFNMRKAMEIAADGSKDKMKNLRSLWVMYETDKWTGLDGDQAINAELSVQMALEEVKKGDFVEAAGLLNDALVRVELAEDTAMPSDTEAVSTPSEDATVIPLTAAVEATRAAIEQNMSEQTSEKPADEKDKEKEGEKDKEAENELSEGERAKMAEAFMSQMGFPYDKKNPEPASVAVRDSLMEKIKEKDDIEGLEAFIDNAKYGDPIDAKYEQSKSKQIQDILDKKIPDMEQINLDLSSISTQIDNQKKPPKEKKRQKLMTQSRALLKQKRVLENDIKELDTAFERSKTKEAADTKYILRPEQLLGMINIYFAKKAMDIEYVENGGKGKKKTPNYAEVMAETQEQLQKAYEAQSGKRSILANYANPLSYFKPRLTSTLKAIVEGDELLKKITPEQATKLAKTWDKPGGAHDWIRSLEGSEQENMTTVVPRIIGHLVAAVNEGRSARLHPISISRGRGLLKNLRNAVHEYSISSAEKGGGESLDKMRSYFDHLNDVNKKASTVNYDVVSKHARWSIAKNIGKTVGVAGAATGLGAAAYGTYAGATALAGWGGSAYASLAGLSGLQMAGVGAGVAATGATVGSFAVEDPKTKAFLRRSAFRLAAATGLGALTVASAPFAALPAMASTAITALASAPWLTIGASAGGFFLPDIWKGRSKVAKGTGEVVKGTGEVVKGTAKVAAGTAYVGGRVGWAYTGAVASLLGLGLPLFSKRYRNFFGIHTRPLFKEEFGSSSLPAARKPATASMPTGKPANDNVTPFNKQRLDHAA